MGFLRPVFSDRAPRIGAPIAQAIKSEDIRVALFTGLKS